MENNDSCLRNTRKSFNGWNGAGESVTMLDVKWIRRQKYIIASDRHFGRALQTIQSSWYRDYRPQQSDTAASSGHNESVPTIRIASQPPSTAWPNHQYTHWMSIHPTAPHMDQCPHPFPCVPKLPHSAMPIWAESVIHELNIMIITISFRLQWLFDDKNADINHYSNILAASAPIEV